MLTITLTNEESEILQEELQSHRNQLEQEILHTTTASFKVWLKKRLEILNGLAEKLASPTSPAS